MFLPKTEIFEKLKELDASVSQANQGFFHELPAITFMVAENSPNYGLNGEILTQEITATVDIWAKNSTECSELLSKIEQKMRQIGYYLEFSSDAPNPDSSLFHITTRFNSKK